MTTHRIFPLGLAAAVALACVPDARAAESYDGCKGFITSLPAVISTQGTWCFSKDLATSSSGIGAAITVSVNNVTIDCNGFKLGNLGGGTATQMNGIQAVNRSNVGIRGCTIRGFRRGVLLQGSGGGHVIEDNRIESSTIWGIYADGGNLLIRNNQVFDIGQSTEAANVPACGIEAHGSADIHGNTVADVRSTGTDGATGIAVIAGPGSTVRDNVVREVVNQYQYVASIAMHTGYATVRGNTLTSDGANGTIGVQCGDVQVAVRDNDIAHFEDPTTAGCTLLMDNQEY